MNEDYVQIMKILQDKNGKIETMKAINTLASTLMTVLEVSEVGSNEVTKLLGFMAKEYEIQSMKRKEMAHENA